MTGDSNLGPLASEATALPTEPQPLPNIYELVVIMGHPLLLLSPCLSTYIRYTIMPHKAIYHTWLTRLSN